MPELVAAFVAAFALAVVVVAWQRIRVSRATHERLFGDEPDTEADPLLAPAVPDRTFNRRHLVLPWLAGAGVGAVLYLAVGLPALFAATFALIVGLLSVQFDGLLYGRKNLKIEMQLADSIDLMVGALHAGAGAVAALDTAAREAPLPLRPQLEEVQARIRYGDDPQAVFQSLTHRVPLETFLLFASTLSVHWESGGTLGPTLAAVGRTIRDRIELSRRIRSNSVQAQISMLIVLALTYLVAARMWDLNPEQMRSFLASPTASWFVAGTMLLQAVGIVWMSSLSRMRF